MVTPPFNLTIFALSASGRTAQLYLDFCEHLRIHDIQAAVSNKGDLYVDADQKEDCNRLWTGYISVYPYRGEAAASVKKVT